jgi:ribosomal-protein-alanine N-acetyltransferase
MKKTEVLRTKRLYITPQTDAQMEVPLVSESDEHMAAAIAQMLKGCREHPENRLWYTLWVITLKGGTVVGSLGFKGPQVNGEVEIGYGIQEEFRGCGNAAEAAKALMDWAFTSSKVYFITAEAVPDNKASLRVLEKLGFAPAGDGLEGLRFEKEKPPSSWMAVYMCLGVGVGISLGNLLGGMAIGTSLGLCIGIAIGASLDGQDRKMREKLRAARDEREKS